MRTVGTFALEKVDQQTSIASATAIDEAVRRALRGRYVAPQHDAASNGGIFEGHRQVSAAEARDRETGRLISGLSSVTHPG